MLSKKHGWTAIVDSLNADLERIIPGYEINDASVGDYGTPLFTYNVNNLNEQQADFVKKRVARAEDIALATCVVCGQEGAMCFQKTPPRARVLCELHQPKSWVKLT